MKAHLRVASAVVPLALAAAACGSSSAGSTGTTPPPTSAAASSAASDAAALLPAAVKAKGTLTVAADASYAPNEFFDKDGKTVIGMDPDLAKALGTVLGLKVSVVNASFDSILAGIASGRYDLAMSSFTDNKKREKTVDFVTYFSAGTSFFEKKGGPALSGLDDLCGHTVAVEKGTTQLDDATALSNKCKAEGKKKATVLTFPDQSGANLALSSGRAEISMADSPVADYQVKTSSGAFVTVGTPYGTAPYGIGSAKGSGLAQAVQAALKQLIADGTYTKILTTWGIQDGAITTPVIDGATS